MNSWISERGHFLALDLGGTNFRVLLVHLNGEKDFKVHSQTYGISEAIMLGSGEELFDHIADCLANFVKVSSHIKYSFALESTMDYVYQ